MRNFFKHFGWIVAISGALFVLIIAIMASCVVVSPQEDITLTITALDGTTSSIQVAPGSIKLTPPEMYGYEFQGYYSLPDGGQLLADKNGASCVEFDKSTVLYTRWKPLTYYLTFNAGEGMLDKSSMYSEISYGQKLEQMPMPEREGYVFKGWADEKGTLYSDEDIVLPPKRTFEKKNYPITDDGVTLYAQYEIKVFTVTFDQGDGTSSVLKIEYGQLLDPVALPAKDTGSARIIGWTSVPGSRTAFEAPITTDLTLYPIWKNYQVFLLDDTVGRQTQVTVYQDEPLDLTTYEGVVRPGYEAEGWYVSENFSGNPVTALYYGSADKIFYAKWNRAVYTVTYDTATAGKTIDSFQYEMGDTIELAEPERKGYNFNGWCTKKDLSDVPFRSITENDWGNKTLYASFTPTTFHVTLNASGGSVNNSTADVRYQDSYELPVPTRLGYIFTGWYDGEKTASARSWTDEKGNSLQAYSALTDTVLYAGWKAGVFSVVFDPQNGDEKTTVEYTYGTSLKLPKNPEKTGMIFAGWYDKNETVMITADAKPADNMKLHAKWMEGVIVKTADELRAIANNPNGNYFLGADINLGGSDWTPIPEFAGLLDGRGYSITNFIMSIDGSLGGMIQTNTGTICNLKLNDFMFRFSSNTGDSKAGTIAAINKGSIKNCSVLGGTIVFSQKWERSVGRYTTSNSSATGFFGGAIGVNEGRIESCTLEVTFSVDGSSINTQKEYDGRMCSLTLYFGGLCGKNTGTIDKSSVTGHSLSSIYAKKNGYYYDSDLCASCILREGGFVGINDKGGSIQHCRVDFESELTSSGIMERYTDYGGFVSNNNGSIQYCSSYGTAVQTNNAFTNCNLCGFVYNNNGSISNCFADVEIKSTGTAAYLAGFAGYNQKTIQCSVSNTSIVAQGYHYLGGFAARNVSGGGIMKCMLVGSAAGDKANNSGIFIACPDSGSTTAKCYYNKSYTFRVNNVVTALNESSAEAYPADLLLRMDFIRETLSFDTTYWSLADGQIPELIEKQ